MISVHTVEPCFIVPRFTAKLAYLQRKQLTVFTAISICLDCLFTYLDWQALLKSPRCDIIDWHYDRGLNNSKLTVMISVHTVEPCFIVPRFTAKLAYRQEFLQSHFLYVVITPLKCQTRIPPSATVIKDQMVSLLLFKPQS
jgi:hypothetical protein